MNTASWTARAIACVLATSLVAAQAQTQAPLTDLGYAAQPGKSLYLAANYEGKPVNMIRTGALGEGRVQVFTGSLTDRVRTIIDDTKGLQEVLAMDRGQRMTVRRVGNERIEYRLYAPDRRFLIGSVLYKNKNQWLHGLMKTEAFGGYGALVQVSDVTAKVVADTPVAAAGWSIGQRMARRWERFNLITPAYAEEENLIKGFFSQSATEARQRWSAPLREMIKGSMVGAGAFTVKLVGQSIGYAETAAAGSAIVAAAPFLVAVGTGVAIGLAADKVVNWADGKNLTGTSSLRDLVNRLTADTRFTRETAPVPPADLPGASEAPAAAQRAPGASAGTSRPAQPAADTSAFDLLSMSDQLDSLDKRDFKIAMDIADLCIRKRDLACANEQIATASKSANSGADRQQIALARKNVEATRERMVAEERAQAEAARRAEQERIAQAQREQSAQKDSGFQWGKAGVLLAGGALGGLGKLAAEKKVDVLTGIIKDSMAGQEGISNTTQALNANAPVRAGAGNSAASTLAGGASGSPASQVWHDSLTTREVKSGRVNEYPNHSENIPGDVVMRSVGSRAAAQSVWSGQGGNVTEYAGCGACGVGSSIRITVRYDHIVDYHVYTRDK